MTGACSLVYVSSSSTLPVSTEMVPPSGIASRALTTRLTRICSSCPGSAATYPRATQLEAIAMSSPIRRRSIGSTVDTTVFMSSTLGCRICFRLNARSCLVSPDARSAAFLICFTSSLRGSVGSNPSMMISVLSLITVRRLLKSWAIPPASRPTASIFCDCRNCSSRLRRSVRSIDTRIGPLRAPLPVLVAPSIPAVVEHGTQVGGDSFTIFGMNVIVPPLDLGVDLVLFVAEHVLNGIIPDERVRLDVPIPYDVMSRSCDELESLVGCSNCALRLALIRHVDDDPDRRDDRAGLVENWCRAHSDEPVGVVAATNANFFAAHRLLRRDRSRQGPFHCGVRATIVMESDPLAVAIEVRRRIERDEENFRHLRIHRHESTRWHFGDHHANRHLLLDRVSQGSLSDHAELRVAGGAPCNPTVDLRHDSRRQR